MACVPPTVPRSFPYPTGWSVESTTGWSVERSVPPTVPGSFLVENLRRANKCLQEMNPSVHRPPRDRSPTPRAAVERKGSAFVTPTTPWIFYLSPEFDCKDGLDVDLLGIRYRPAHRESSESRSFLHNREGKESGREPGCATDRPVWGKSADRLDFVTPTTPGDSVRTPR